MINAYRILSVIGIENIKAYVVFTQPVMSFIVNTDIKPVISRQPVIVS
jgi:hypothetical protein